MHVHRKTGDVLPTLFSHAERKGCSVQRECADSDEIATLVRDFLGAGANRKWLGVVSANVGDLRRIRVDGSKEQAICVYDTAEPRNPAHAEFTWNGGDIALDEGDGPELRKLLLDAFTAGKPMTPEIYRGGNLRI